jgi:pimeloyl-ACP methyl ester carboxylesterase
MAEDVRRLMDHLRVACADVMGYSMGARISAFLALNHPARVRSLVSGGLGLGLVEGVGDAALIVEALLAPSLQHVGTQRGRMFRAFADQTKSDRIALAACMSAMRELIPAETVRRIAVPTLVAVGTKDAIAGSAQGLADLIPAAKVLDIPDRDHMPAVGDRVYKAGVLRFLESRP